MIIYFCICAICLHALSSHFLCPPLQQGDVTKDEDFLTQANLAFSPYLQSGNVDSS